MEHFVSVLFFGREIVYIWTLFKEIFEKGPAEGREYVVDYWSDSFGGKIVDIGKKDIHTYNSWHVLTKKPVLWGSQKYLTKIGVVLHAGI